MIVSSALMMGMNDVDDDGDDDIVTIFICHSLSLFVTSLHFSPLYCWKTSMQRFLDDEIPITRSA